MKNFFQNAQQINTLRKLIGWDLVDEALKSRLDRQVCQQPPNGKVLVLAAQPGDEIFALGGTLALHRDQGDEVRILYLCDGRTGSKRRTTEIVREEIKKTRRAEAVASAQILSIAPGNLIFWGYRDYHLAANKTTIKALAQILTDYMPRTIYAPHVADLHDDHVATAQILAGTLAAMGGNFPATIWSYELWQPTYANRLIEIGTVEQHKEAAVDAHISQEKVHPYKEAIRALNTYRGRMQGLSGPAEAFLALPSKLYIKLWEILRSTGVE